MIKFELVRLVSVKPEAQKISIVHSGLWAMRACRLPLYMVVRSMNEIYSLVHVAGGKF